MMKSEQHDPTITHGSPTTSTRRRTMMKSEQQNPTTTPTTPGSPTSSGHHSDHHSELTDSTADDENFITLLQYKDAYHILNLSQEPISSSSSSRPIPPEQIQAAYESAKEQVLTALDQCEASEKKNQLNNNGRKQRMFFMSQQNYLELKLQALDQAYEELMPMEVVNVVHQHQNEIQNEKTAANHLVHREEEGAVASSTRDTMDDVPSFHKGLEREAPSVETGSRQFLGNDTSTTAVKSGYQTTSSQQQQHRRLPSEDELDTIDIYFRPSPGQSNSSDTRPPRSRPKSPENPSDMSSITWDSSSIFSIVSKTKQNLEEASIGGLSEVLGPIYNSSPTRSVSTPPSQTLGVKTIPTTTTMTNQSVDNRRNNRRSRNRPPLAGIDNTAKEENPKGPQISPKSIMDFPSSSSPAAVVVPSSSTHNNNDEHYNDVGRVETMPRITHASSSSAHHRRHHRHRHNSNNAATEAARMGILRALSEDNSECLPLDDDDIDHNYLNLSNDNTNVNSSDRCQFNMSKSNKERGGGVSKSRRFFQGKSDYMPKESNSLMASVLNDKPMLYDQTTNREQSAVAPLPQCSNAAAVAPKSVSSSSASSSRRKGKLTTTTTPNTPQQPGNYEDLLQSSQYSYDAILQSGMEFADELCLALGSCWNGGEVGYSAAAASAFAAASPERSVTTSRFRGGDDDDESTHFTRSTYDNGNANEYDDSTYQTQSVLTGLTGAEDSSTAFNTTSSFSRRTEDDLNEGRKSSSSPITIMSSDPPPRMLV
mmetsp:Transcript_28157/g.53151  ORF Transcript_28157/g.53151 Transcript_28157/m.53151 type:complete len:765 (-) Transcript_28157:325-2619(-)